MASKDNNIEYKLLSILAEFDLSKKIEIIERLGKRLRRHNSIESAKEVNSFAVQLGNKKKIYRS